MFKINLNELIKGKETKIFNKQFKNTSYYVQPFIDMAHKYNVEDFYIQVKAPHQVNTVNGEIDFDNITFNKVLIHAILPSNYEYANYVGLTYALDVKEPVLKTYRGIIHKPTNNTFSFDVNPLKVQLLKNDLNYDHLEDLFKSNNLDFSIFRQLEEHKYTYRDIKYLLGNWVNSCIHTQVKTDAGIVMVPAELPVAIFKNLYINQNSPYLVNTTDFVSKAHLLHTFANYCLNNNRDIINVFEKNSITSSILEI